METFQEPVGAKAPPTVPGHDAVRCLGSGAQGQVWLLSPHNGSGPVAAKFFDVVGAGSLIDMKSLTARHNDSQDTSEWRVLTRFHHEHLIALHALVQDVDGGHVLLMDFAAGGSLAQIIQARGALSVGETVTVLTPMGQVLAFLHGQGAVHGDVSPGNILLTAAGKPVLSDFGLGRLLGESVDAAGGTPGFRCLADTVRDDAGDVYALAAVGWFALTGRLAPPTRDRPPLSSLVPGVPSELVAALEAGLHEEPGLRPTAAAFAQAVFRSSPAEALALGNAVHPSVLPLLSTMHGSAGRGRSRARRAAAHAAAGNVRRRRPLAVDFWRRFLRGRTRGGSWRQAAPLLLTGVGLAAMVAVLGSLVLGGVWADGGERNAVGEPSGSLLVGEAPGADMSWAGALPAEIQAGVQAVEPVTALHALAWLRSFALSNADQGLLEHVNAAGSAALEADMSTAQELLERGHTLTGFESSIVQAQTLSSPPSGQEAGDAGAVENRGRAQPVVGGTAVVLATVHTGAFAEQDSTGVLVHRQAHEQRQELDFVLVRVGEGWRIAQVLAVENK